MLIVRIHATILACHKDFLQEAMFRSSRQYNLGREEQNCG